MKKEKLYFENEDSEVCYPLCYHIDNAKENGLSEIELFEAIPETGINDIIWCSEVGSTVDKSECDKTCPEYSAPEKGRMCKRLGRLMTCGKQVKFSVENNTEQTIKTIEP